MISKNFAARFFIFSRAATLPEAKTTSIQQNRLGIMRTHPGTATKDGGSSRVAGVTEIEKFFMWILVDNVDLRAFLGGFKWILSDEMQLFSLGASC